MLACPAERVTSIEAVLDVGQIATVTVHHSYKARPGDGPPAPSGATSEMALRTAALPGTPMSRTAAVSVVACRRLTGGASSAGRSAVAETWLPNTASTPGTRAHRRRPADRAQAFPAGRPLPVALCLTGRVGRGVPLMARGAELNHTARCQPESHRRHAYRLWRPVVLRRLQRFQPHGPDCLHES